MSRPRRLPAAVVILLGLLVGTYCIWAIRTRDGVGVTRADATPLRLPMGAANINYHVAPPASYYDFDTTEAGFAEFVADWGLPWGEGSGERKATWAWRWDHTADKRVEVEIADGTFYGWSKDDAGRYLAFDHRTGRAYCFGSYR